MVTPSKDDVCGAAARVAFGKPLIQNNLRGLVFEVIVEFALKQDWDRCSGDWKGWDFEHKSGHTRLEVKQSARRQSWARPALAQPARFDIAVRTGYYEGADWTAHSGRNAHLYVFGYHPVDDETADHRDPEQWRFYVVPTTKLPPTKTVGLSTLNTLSTACGWAQLSEAVEQERTALTKPPA